MTAIALLSVAACAKKVAAVSKPADITPVALLRHRQRPRRPGLRPRLPRRREQVAVQPSKPTTMPADVRKKLDEYLAKLEDALFDYDQSTIRIRRQRRLAR